MWILSEQAIRDSPLFWQFARGGALSKLPAVYGRRNHLAVRLGVVLNERCSPESPSSIGLGVLASELWLAHDELEQVLIPALEWLRMEGFIAGFEIGSTAGSAPKLTVELGHRKGLARMDPQAVAGFPQRASGS